MITPETLAFLAGPVVSALATANASHEPWFTRTILVEAENGSAKLDVYFPQVTSARPLADLRANAKAAVLVVNITNFQARQFKGTVVAQREATPEEISRMRLQHAKPAPIMGQFWGAGAETGWTNYIVDPAVCITLEIQAIFDQTPKPGAGARIS